MENPSYPHINHHLWKPSWMENHPCPHLWKPSVSICVRSGVVFVPIGSPACLNNTNESGVGITTALVRMQAMTHWTFGVLCLEVDYRYSKQQVGAY